MRQELTQAAERAAKPKVDQTLETAREELRSASATASWMRGWTMEPEEAVRFGARGG